ERGVGSGGGTSWSSLFLPAMVCDWASGSRISSGSTATAPRPLFCRYCEIIEAATTGSSRAPGTAMSTYIADVSSGVSDAQAPSNNVAEIAAAARSDIMSPKSGGVVAYQPWLKGEFSGLGPAQIGELIRRRRHRMDAAFGLGAAAPTAGALVLVGRGAAGAGHAADREVAGGGQGMRRQTGGLEDGLDPFARDIGEGIELQPSAVLLDHGDVGAQSALETLATVDPGIEGLQRALERLHFTDAAAGVGIVEPELAVGILARQRLLQRLDRTHVAQPELFDQRIAIGQRLLEQPAGVEEDHGDRRIDIGHHLQQ